MDILLSYALGWEVKPLLRTLRSEGTLMRWADGTARFSYRRLRVTTMRLGMGASCARQGMLGALAAYKPDLVLMAGFSGGLHDHQRTGDIALPEIFARLGEDTELTSSNPGAIRQALDWILRQRRVRLLQEKRAVSPIVPVHPKEKRALGLRWPDACGVDLESYAVAKVCAGEDIPFLCARTIYDAVDQRLPTLASLWELPLWYLRYRRAAASLAVATQFLLDTIEKGSLNSLSCLIKIKS